MTRTIATTVAVLVSMIGADAAHADAHENAPATAPVQTADVDEGAEQAGAELVLSASFVSRYELRDNYLQAGLVGRRLGENDGIAYRARLGLTTTVIDLGNGYDVEIDFVPQASGFMGDVSGGLTDAGLGVHEAKVTLFKKSIAIEVGRFEMAYGEHLVIGNVDWHETGRAFDGIRVHSPLRTKGAYIDAFATQVAEGSGIGAGTLVGGGDVYFGGVYAGIGPLLKEGLELDLYALVQAAPETVGGPTPHDHEAVEITVGSRIKRTFGKVTARGEFGAQFGKRAVADESVLAFQADADVMARVHDKAKIGLGGTFASGDDPTSDDIESWNQLYPTAHKFLGQMDVIGGRSNVAAAVLKTRLRASKPLLFALDGHLFFRPETAMGTDGYAGLELDAWAHYGLAKGLGVRGQYSILLPNEDGPLATDTELHYVEIQLRLDH